MLITEQENTMSSRNFVPYCDHVNSHFKSMVFQVGDLHKWVHLFTWNEE